MGKFSEKINMAALRDRKSEFRRTLFLAGNHLIRKVNTYNTYITFYIQSAEGLDF